MRIEDLDFYRCKKEYTKLIIQELYDLGFEYDAPPYIQSEHTDVYKRKVEYLIKNHEAFYCTCTRASLKAASCQCLKNQHEIKKQIFQSEAKHSIRYQSSADESVLTFKDALKGSVTGKIADTNITLVRADSVISYNLGCVTDDIDEGITEVVRGSDLIDITPVQQSLYRSFGCGYIDYLHLPLVMQDDKYKLSKQNHSRAVMLQEKPSVLLIKALEFLNQDVSVLNEKMSCRQILKKAADRFDIRAIPTEPKLSPF